MSYVQRIYLGRVEIDGELAWVTVDVELSERKDGKLRLSMMGNIDRHSAGQVQDTIRENLESFRSNRKRMERILEIWDGHHLNDLHAGTPAQEAILRAYEADWLKAKAEGTQHYDWACGLLQRLEMYEVNGYRYGQSWLFEEIPPEIVKEIRRGL